MTPKTIDPSTFPEEYHRLRRLARRQIIVERYDAAAATMDKARDIALSILEPNSPSEAPEEG